MKGKNSEKEHGGKSGKGFLFLAPGIGTRIKAVADQFETRSKAADAAGVSDDMLYRYIREQSPPSFSAMAGLAAATGTSLEWLATGEGDSDIEQQAPSYGLGDSAPNVLTALGDEYAPVPLYDVRASAGHGALVEGEQVADALVFKRQWIHQELHANPADLYLIHVDGESMEPTLRPGDVILVDRRNAQAVPRDGIYVLRMDGSLLVKRLQRLPGKKVKVTSDNPAYEPFELTLDDPGDDMAIIGRVVWSGRRM